MQTTNNPILQKKKKAFTLVELIIVITILAILATIAFVSFQGYSSQSRDSNRMATVKNIENGVNIFITKTGKVPEPDDVIGSGRLTSGGPVLNIVGKVGAGISRSINLNETPLDPRAQEQYWYGVDTLRRYYQVGLTLESETAYTPGLLPSYAGNILEAKVQGNYEYPLKLDSIVYSLPSLLFLGSGGVLNNQTEFVVDEGTNVPYTFGQAKSGTQSVAEVLKIITGTGNLSLTGVSLPTMTLSDYKSSTGSEIPSAFSGVAQLLGITDKTKLGMVVYGKEFVGVGVSGGNLFIKVETCTGWTYGSWSVCQDSGNELRNILTSQPSGCIGGSPLISRPCTFTNQNGSTSNYLSDITHGSLRFACYSGSCGVTYPNNGIVKDLATGLYWQSSYSSATYGWAGAKSYCENLEIGEFSDWRLPDVTEFESIINYSSNIGMDSNYFARDYSNPPSSLRTSISTQLVVSGTYHAYVFGNVGNATPYDKSITGHVRVKCVRGPKSYRLPRQGTFAGYYDSKHNVGTSNVAEVRLACNGNCNSNNSNTGVVYDSVTKLYWQSGLSQQKYNWTNAFTYCNNLELGEYSDWRLPNKKEADSIINYSQGNPQLQTGYFSSNGLMFWTSTTYSLGNNVAWLCSSDFFVKVKTDEYYIKCVR